jgi:alkylation response protein AidB-like acyl-CoA dehydrogenase
MSNFYSKAHLDFLLFKVHRIADLCALDYFKDHNEETFKMVLESAHSLSEKHLYPIHLEMDYNEPQLVDGNIKVHPKMKALMKLFGEQGWISANFTYEEGGQQLPSMICWGASFIMGAANYSAVVYPGLTMGASELIRLFASNEQKETYLPKMFAGEWQGTMALTEPEAGSSLSDIVTTAYKTDEGHYLIKGQKIFISCGDHDATENIVHLMLARVKDAPKGAKGISLFIVPKKRLTASGALESNDVITAGIYHKLGYKGAPIAHLMMGESDDCRGYLIGDENMGLNYMFKMMNGARISVGMHSISIASAAYYGSLQYAQERKQGRIISDKDVTKPQVPIIQHADVKRMLLFQKAIIEGSLSLLLQCTRYEDLSLHGEESERAKYAMLLDLLTPIAKTYPAEMGILTTSTAIQIHGGYGYTKDFAAEKYFREIRIHTLHEGTTAMHGMDLLGRKVMMKNGQAVMFLMQEVMADIAKAKSSENLKTYATVLENKMMTLQEVTMHLVGVAQKKGVETFLADATLYLELFSILTVAWQWIKMANVAEQELNKNEASQTTFLKSNLATMRYFFEYEVPKTLGLVERLKSAEAVTVEASEDLLI